MTEEKKLDPELVAEVRRQVLDELKEEEKRKAAEDERKREAERKAHVTYARKMKKSKEPWIEVKGIVDDPEKGVKIELDWNDAFVKYLRENGYTGSDDDTVVQRYVAELSYMVADDMKKEQQEYE